MLYVICKEILDFADDTDLKDHWVDDNEHVLRPDAIQSVHIV